MSESANPTSLKFPLRQAAWFVRSIVRWFDSSAESNQASYDKSQESLRHRLGPNRAVPRPSPHVLWDTLGGHKLDRGGSRRAALLPSNVLIDVVLSPLLLTPHIQDQSILAVLVRRSGEFVRAARAALVGRTPSRSPPPFRQRWRHSLPCPARLLLESHGVGHGQIEQGSQQKQHQRLREVSGVAFPGSIPRDRASAARRECLLPRRLAGARRARIWAQMDRRF